MRPNTIIGVDISYDIKRGLGYCAAVIVDITKLKVLKYSIIVDEVKIPYIPGYLAFREAPLIFKTLKNLDEELVRGSILMINGHGIAHPRRFGIASHIGVVMNLPSIGVAEKMLSGEIISVGGREVIVIDRRIVGIVLSSRRSRKKYYMTIGHKVSIEDLEYYARRTFSGDFRESKPPYPIYLADTISRNARRGEKYLARWLEANRHIF